MKRYPLIGGSLLVAGTTIGAAVLALPLSTGLAGFFPSCVAFVVCFFSMLFSSHLFLEATLWIKGKDPNLVTIAKAILGPFGKCVSWTVYLALLYCLEVAYLSGGVSTIIKLFSLPDTESIKLLLSGIVVLALGYLLYTGKTLIDRGNRFLMMGLLVIFVALSLLLFPHVQLDYLRRSNWSLFFPTLPIVITAFGFHIIIPSLVSYFNRCVSSLKQSFLVGLSLPLLMYVAWQYLIVGSLPITGINGLQSAYEKGKPITDSLVRLTGHSWISIASQLFAFFAISTSLLGVSLSLFDFLADALPRYNEKKAKKKLLAFTLLPPVFFVFSFPRAFLQALEYGSIFVALLLIILPAILVWVGRYHRRYQGPYRAKGGKVLLVAQIGFGVLIILFALLHPGLV